jgi:hypothetical protein
MLLQKQKISITHKVCKKEAETEKKINERMNE